MNNCTYKEDAPGEKLIIMGNASYPIRIGTDAEKIQIEDYESPGIVSYQKPVLVTVFSMNSLKMKPFYRNIFAKASEYTQNYL